MRRCPHCLGIELEEDCIGGTGHGPAANAPRSVLLCPKCWSCYPMPTRHLAVVPTERRDLA